MEKIAVIGLGIIGGSICAALTKAGYLVDGTDLKEENVLLAVEKGYIQAKAEDISQYDTVFLAIPPQSTISALENMSFKDGALVADICGVKLCIEQAVYAKARNYRYVGLHPMAGKETSGLASASAALFAMANLIITIADKTEKEALEQIKIYAKAMRFGRIIECSAVEHDKKIALTSQLPHIVSNAFVKSQQVKNCEGFTGGSFQDMTRIAGVDENIWTQLYMSNREYALEELTLLIEHLEKYRVALENADAEGLAECLKEGRLIREKIKRGKN